jgi:RNA polymerase sigma factor (sigma-70 family)
MSDQQTRNDPISALQRLTEPAAQGAMQSDAELLTLFVESGSRTAIETLIQRYAGMVASVCRCTVSDPASAEDAFQATFLVLLKSAKKIQNRRSVAAWLHGVAYRTASRLRKQRLANVSEQSPDEVIALNQADEDPINILARKLELEALDQELEKLPQGLREILVEHYLLGYTAPQIAERTALSVSAIEGRIRRGRYALLRQLASWFQQHLQTMEANEWTENFLESYLPEDASPTDWDFETNSDTISSLVRGEMNMFNATILKTVYSAGATLLVGGLITFNLFGFGDRPSAGLQKSDDVGFTMQTLPEETTTVVAQFGSRRSSS